MWNEQTIEERVEAATDRQTDRPNYSNPHVCAPRVNKPPSRQNLIRSRLVTLGRLTFVLGIVAQWFVHCRVSHWILSSVPNIHVRLQSHPRRPPLNRVPLVTTYHPSLIGLARIAKKHLPILHISRRLKQAFQTTTGGIQNTQEPLGFACPSQLT